MSRKLLSRSVRDLQPVHRLAAEAGDDPVEQADLVLRRRVGRVDEPPDGAGADRRRSPSAGR